VLPNTSLTDVTTERQSLCVEATLQQLTFYTMEKKNLAMMFLGVLLACGVSLCKPNIALFSCADLSKSTVVKRHATVILPQANFSV